MRKVILTAASALLGASALLAVGATHASAGAFCATEADGQNNKNCGYATYRQCARSISGTTGSCIANPDFGGYGYQDDSYAYVPGPSYGPAYGPAYGPGPYGYDVGPRYRRPGFGVYIGGY